MPYGDQIMTNYSKYSDQELADWLKKEDVLAYEEIYKRYWQIMYRFSRKLLQNSQFAEDVVQDVFTILWHKATTISSDVPIAAYLYRLTRNKILDKIKHSKVEDKYLAHLAHTMKYVEALPDQLHIEGELFKLIEREIDNLPKKMRLVFEMRRMDFKTNQQIADELGISVQTVKNQLGTATRTLRNKLGETFNIFLIFF